jgi:hypothetical protein
MLDAHKGNCSSYDQPSTLHNLQHLLLRACGPAYHHKMTCPLQDMPPLFCVAWWGLACDFWLRSSSTLAVMAKHIPVASLQVACMQLGKCKGTLPGPAACRGILLWQLRKGRQAPPPRAPTRQHLGWPVQCKGSLTDTTRTHLYNKQGVAAGKGYVNNNTTACTPRSHVPPVMNMGCE